MWGLKILIAATLVVLLAASCTLLRREPPAVIGPSARVLGTQIVVRGEGSAKWHHFDFNVPESGYAKLRLSNGAKTGSLEQERVQGAEVTLNGKRVITRETFNEQTDILAVPVYLQGGTNKLSVKLLAAPGKRLSVRVDAPADKVVLTPLLIPVVLGREPLRAQATVTGLGRPVARAPVQFEVLELGPKLEGRAFTGDAGRATTLMTGFTSGDGVLRATVADAALSDVIRVQVVLTGLGERTGFDFSTRGPEPSVLNVPSAVPSGVLPASKPTVVTFRTLVVGTPNPPDKLLLDEVTSEGDAIAKGIAELRDNGKGGDQLAGDGFYAGALDIASPEENGKPVEGEKYYRLRLELPEKDVTSGIATFPITELPLKARPSDPKTLVDDPRSADKLYANEVIVAALPGVSPRRIRTIVEQVGQALEEKPITVGFLPSIRFYLVEIEGDRTAAGVRRAITTFLTYEEIEDAWPNFEGRAADAGSPSDPWFSCDPTNPGDPPKNPADCQYYLQAIRAADAWNWLKRQGVITSSSMADPTVISTSENHNLTTGNSVVIAGHTGSVPPINGIHIITVIGPATFSIPVNVTTSGTEGTFEATLGITSSSMADPTVISTSENHNLTTDNSVVIAGHTGSVPPINGVHIITVTGPTTFSIPVNVTTSGTGGTFEATLGSDFVKVAVIDSGIDDLHVDLQGQLSGGSNTGTKQHGTTVAGLIAAKHNNNLGIAGVAPATKLIPFEYGSAWTTAAAIVDAVGMSDAKIINISRQFTGDLPNPGELPPKNSLENATCHAICDDRLVVAVAGNANCGNPLTFYPGNYDDGSTTCSCGTVASDGMFTVGAIADIDRDGDGYVDDNDSAVVAANFARLDGLNCSSVQTWVDIYAPGEQIQTTASTLPTDNTSVEAGTSYAAPLVSGAAAVLWAAYPGWTDQDVEVCLRTRDRPLDVTPGNQVHPLLTLAGMTQADIIAALGGIEIGGVVDLLTALNHAPTDITLSNNTVPENFAGAVVGTLGAVDHCVTIATSNDATKPDGVTYTVSDGRFEVVLTGNVHELKLKNGNALDYPADCNITGTDCTVALTITATDAEGLSYLEDFTLTVTEQAKMCWPPHRGVPFNPSAPTIDGTVQADVGWRGAHRLTYGDGTDPANLAFQGLKQNDDKYLYLSFEVRNDATFDDDDLVVINFRKSASGATVADDRRIFIYPLCNDNGAEGPSCSPTAPDDKVDRPPRWVRAWKDSANWTELPQQANLIPVPNLEVKVRSHTDGSSKAWYVELKVPTTITDGGPDWIDFADDFLFYFNVIRVSSGTAVEFRWPRNAPVVVSDPDPVEDYPFSPQEWGLGSKSNSATCKGLSLTWADVGTLNTPSSLIKFDDPATTTPNTFTNTFFATVHNDTEVGGVPQPASGVRVRFRIANWGLPPPDQWTDVPASSPPPGCIDLNQHNPTCPFEVPAANSGVPGAREFNLNWILSQSEIDFYKTNRHQCILAEIDSLSDAKVVTKSVHRNMNFVSASKFERRAEISAKGYGPPPQGMTSHQFDLHVTTREFKSEKDEDQEIRGKHGRQISKLLAMAKSYDKKRRSMDVDTKEKTSDEEGHQVSRLIWVTQGYHHTGKFITINKNRYPIVDPVGSFGYVVSHEGPPVKQWNQRLGGAKNVAKNLYRLTLKPGEAAQVTTRVEPKEECKNLFQCICNWFRNLK